MDEKHVPRTDDLAAVEQWRENMEAKVEPTTAEAFTAVRRALVWMGDDSNECHQAHADGALALLERRMGALADVAQGAAYGGCEEMPGPCGDCLACRAKSALADAPSVFTLEEVEAVCGELKREWISPHARGALSEVSERLKTLTTLRR